MRKRFCAIILAVAMVMTMIPVAVAASPSSYDDISGHWAESSIDRWSGYGVVNGAGDGQFAPDRTLTRAEAAQIFANLLGLTATASLGQYVDVAVGSWYYDAIAKCVAAGILTGTGGATMSPETVISRQELFVMYARALSIQPQDSADTSFTDSASVASWAAGYINALADMGAIQGGGDGSLDPAGDINRASFVALLDQSISGYANTDNATVGGTSGIVLVVADNVTVMGNVETLVVVGGSAGVSGSSVGTITVTGDNASVSVGGSASVGQVNVTGANAAVTVSGEAAVTTVTVADTAENATVTVNGDATVSAVDSAAAGVTISGSGTVETANVSGNNTTVNTDGTDLTVSQGTTGVTENGNTVAGGETVTTQPEETEPEPEPSDPVDPPIYIPNYYTVTFVNTDKETIGSQTVVEYTTGLTAPEVGNVGEEEKVSWYNGIEVVDLSTIVVTSNLTLTAVVGSDDFTAGNGTETYPYLISTANELIAMGTLSNEMIDGTAYYFELVNDIYLGLHTATVSGDYNSICTGFRGEVEGNGYTIYSATDEFIFLIADTYGDVTIRNLDIVQQGDLNFSLIYLVNRKIAEPGNVLVQDIEVRADGVIGTVNNIGSFVVDAFGTGADSSIDGTLTLDNCDNYADINVSGYAGVFLGGYNDNGYVRYIDCDNYGEISGEKVGLFTGNSWNAGTDYASARVTVTNCYNHAEMYGLVSCSAFASNNKPADLGYTDEQKSYNMDVSAINVGGGSMEIVDALEGLDLSKVTHGENGSIVMIVPSASSDVASYEIRVFAQNSFKRANGTNAGSSYVMLRVTGDKNITLPLISKMVSSASTDPAVDFDGVTNREIYSNSRYVLVDNADGSKTMYVHEQDMLDNFGDGATSVTLDSATRYTVYAKDAEGRIIGAATYWYNNLPVAETESEIEEEGTSVEETTNIEKTPNTEESEA